jgi:type IV secretory pathway VirB4 component
VIFIDEDTIGITEEDFSAPIFKNLATKVFMPNAEPDAGYKDIIGLTEEEFEIVKRMEIGDRHFLFKHEDDAVIAEIDFSDSVELVKILSPDITTIAAMEEVINVNATPEQPNPDVETWLPQLFEILRAIENERVESEKKQALEAMREQRRRLKAKLEG